MHNHSYENEFNLHVNGISFLYERMSTKTRFEKEAKGYSEMAYSVVNTLVRFRVDFVSWICSCLTVFLNIRIRRRVF